jgi:hypothetical protein
MICCPALLKVAKYQISAIHQLNKFVRNVEVDFSVDFHVEENRANCVLCMYVCIRGGPHPAPAPQPSLIYCVSSFLNVTLY